MSDDATMLEFRKVSCARDGVEVRDVSLSFAAGTSVLLLGHGEPDVQLLLRIASLQEVPDAGEVWLDGEPTHMLSDEGRATIRSRRIGLVYAAPHLLPGLSAVENVAVPLFKILRLDTVEAAERTHAMLDFVGLIGDSGEDVVTLSRGDQQRVALARALVHRPAVLALDRADDALTALDAASFRASVERACAELGVLAISTPSLAPVGPTGTRRVFVSDGVVSVEP
ncbi:MAG: ATP-binding cassette domain-containing protein [Chthoniobacteraceae bacterium]